VFADEDEDEDDDEEEVEVRAGEPGTASSSSSFATSSTPTPSSKELGDLLPGKQQFLEMKIIFVVINILNRTMSADISKRKMVHAIQLKWTFLALKLTVFLS
jgi:hypothetical protein